MLLKAILIYSMPVAAFAALWWSVREKKDDEASLDQHQLRHGCKTDAICNRANKCVFRCHKR